MFTGSENKLIAALIFLSVSFHGIAQKRTIHAKYFVKENVVLLRWIPSDKDVFDLAVESGYKLTRYERENNGNSAPTILADNIKPFAYLDTARWARLIRKDKRAAFIFQALYESKNAKGIADKKELDQELMVYGMMLISCDFNSEIATACGLFFKDSTAFVNKNYTYKIEIVNPPSTLKNPSASVDVNTSLLSTDPEISNLTSSFKNKSVKLAWKVRQFSGSYGGYNIERSADGVEFKKINNAPAILLATQHEKNVEAIIFTDTLPKTRTKYYYRIKGINHFGEESAPSNVVSGIGYEELKSNPTIDSLQVVENRRVFIHWKMSDPQENLLPKEYILMRCEKDGGKYTLINRSSTEFSYTDQKPLPSNYYKIGAITQGDDTLFSFSRLALIIDTIPPLVPKGVKAKVDTKGNVEITWDKNPESDVQGYKIYKANALNEEFVQINNEFAKFPGYKDKLNLKTLSKKIYYSVAATDNNYNTSELSKPIEVKRPDTIPPVSAVIKDLQITQKGINVLWIPSSSEDVKQYILYRENEKNKTTAQIKVWNPTDSAIFFSDTTLELGFGYRYKIVVMDEDDNMSVSNNPYMFYETGFRKKIMDIKFEVDRVKKNVVLIWNYREDEIEKFLVYRGKPGEQLTIIQTLAYPTSNFTDNTLNIGNTYEYRIKAAFKNGAESIISDSLTVEY